MHMALAQQVCIFGKGKFQGIAICSLAWLGLVMCGVTFFSIDDFDIVMVVGKCLRYPADITG